MNNLKIFFSGFNKGIKKFGLNITVLANFILLTITYFAGVGLSSLLSKAVRKEFLETKIQPEQKSYWSDLEAKNKKIKDCYRQF